MQGGIYSALQDMRCFGPLSKHRKEKIMADIPVYMVVNLAVTDADTYRNYEKGFFGILKKYGGEFITYDDKPITLEGDAPREGRMIIFRFPSEQAAQDWYADADYQSLSEHRRAGTKLEFLTLVHGLPPRG
jgi:uncharacterized protein (DUF1330 family)